MYAQFPSWGYFDHPPATPTLIRLGFDLLGGEIGVRIFFVLLHSASLYLFYLISDRKSPKVLFALFFGSIMVHAGGFFAAPDIPLLFFGALFLFILKKYLQEDKWKYALPLGFLAAAILYSKYHGLILLLITVIALPHLLKRISFWGALLLAVCLYLPHILWQLNHDVVTAGYYLEERTSGSHFTETVPIYIMSVLLVTGLLSGWGVMFLAVRHRPEDAFQRLLKGIVVGLTGFFLLFSFRGQIEANWLAQIVGPAGILATAELAERRIFRKWLTALAVASGVILLGYRALLIYPVEGILANRTREFRDYSSVYQDVKAIADDRPLIAKTYQDASKLSFYSPDHSDRVPVLGVTTRSSQFNLWKLSRKLEGGPVCLLDKTYRGSGIPLNNPLYEDGYVFCTDYFISFRDIEIDFEADTVFAQPNEKLPLLWKIRNVRPIHLEGYEHRQLNYGLSYHLWQDGKMIVYNGELSRFSPEVLKTGSQEIVLKAPGKPGNYLLIPDIWEKGHWWWDLKKAKRAVLVVK